MYFLREETEQRGATVIYATHILDGLEAWASHVVNWGIYRGKIGGRGGECEGNWRGNTREEKENWRGNRGGIEGNKRGMN